MAISAEVLALFAKLTTIRAEKINVVVTYESREEALEEELHQQGYHVLGGKLVASTKPRKPFRRTVLANVEGLEEAMRKVGEG